MPFLVDTGLTLETGLKGYWKLDEASGTRLDQLGLNNLVDNNTVTQAAGKVSNAAQFTKANSEWLSCVPTADLKIDTTTWSAAFWCYRDSNPAGHMELLGQYTVGGAVWYVTRNNGNQFEFFVLDSAAGQDGVTASTFGAAPLSTWCFVVVTHDGTNIKVSVNNGALDSLASTRTVFNTVGTSFVIGSALAAAQYWDGRIDEVGFWKKVLSTQEITDLYNGGSGNTYTKLHVPSAGFLMNGPVNLYRAGRVN